MNQILKPRIRHLEAKSATTVIQNYDVTFILQALRSEQFSGSLCSKAKSHGSLYALTGLHRFGSLSAIYLLFIEEGVLACGFLERRLVLETRLLSGKCCVMGGVCT